MRFSVTTVILPTLDLEETVKLLSRLGFQGVEWRVRRIPPDKKEAPFSFWGNHKNDLTPERFLREAAQIRKLCDDHGLRIVSLAAQARADQLEEVKLLADGAAAVAGNGTPPPLLRIGPPRNYDGGTNYHILYREAVEAYGKALEITRPRRVKMVMETHNNTLCVSASLAHRLVSPFSPEDLGVIYDPQNAVVDGYETPQLALELLGPYLAHLHIGGARPVAGKTDEFGSVRWRWERCPLAEGLYDYRRLFELLKKIGYDGFCSLEDFRPGEPEALLTESVKWLRMVGVM